MRCLSIFLTLSTICSLPRCCHTARPRMCSSHCCQSPFSSALAPAKMTSRVVSGGPARGLRSLFSKMRLSALEPNLRLLSCWFATMRGISISTAPTRWQLSMRSWLRCMWYGVWRFFSARSCSWLRSGWNRMLRPCASNSLSLLFWHSSSKHWCASGIRPQRKAERPSCAMTRLKRIWIGTLLIECTESWRCDMSSMSRAW
mmetsp:Transcript_43009/g.99852  ORF Transcript_43009/g.99852 Transcript_43009/m.99852 type:complete len:201 (-) Transcript_43009:1728-2330(-)